MLRASFVKRVLPVLAALALLGCEAEMITDGSGGDAARDLSLLIVSGDNQTGPAGMELPLPLVVKATGPTGLPLKGQVVNFVVTAGGGRVFAGAAVTNAQGIAREYWTLGTVAGAPQALEVRAVNPGNGAKLVFGTFTATAVPGPAARLTRLGGGNQVGLPGLPLTDSLKVEVADQFGNPVSAASVTWVVLQGGGVVAPASVPSNPAGVAATEWTLGPIGVQEVMASVGGLTASFAGTVTPITAGLLAHYPFSGNPNDVSGNGRDGVISGSVALSQDRFGNPGNAYLFAGGWIDIDVLELTGSFSLAAWVQFVPDYNGLVIISNNSTDGALGWNLLAVVCDDQNTEEGTATCTIPDSHWLRLHTGSLLDIHAGNTLTELATPLAPGTWYHVAATYDVSGTATLYVNGTQVATRSGLQPATVSGERALIGRTPFGGGGPWPGSIDEVRVYDRALTAAEVASLASPRGST